MAEELVAAETAVAAAVSPASLDHKRKLEEMESKQTPSETETTTPAVSIPPPSDPPQEESEVKPNDEENSNSVPDAKRPRLDDESDGSVIENGHEVQTSDESARVNAPNTIIENVEVENTHLVSSEATQTEAIQTENVEEVPVENSKAGNEQNASEENLQPSDVHNSSDDHLQQPLTESIPVQTDFSAAQQQFSLGIPEQDFPSAQQQPESEIKPLPRKMEIPNNKVGVLIGKAGETIKYLQYNSGAKIQITRDSEADPSSTTRPVELIGTLEQIEKAEKLIKDVIVEAEAGGSPSLVARGFGIVPAGGPTDHVEIQVPNEKVGLIIGKGGETIKNMQTQSGARIQVLIPQHLPEGDRSTERTVKVTGDKKQIERASEMIKDVMNQPSRHSSRSGGYNQQNYRPRGPTGQPQWGPRAPAQDYQQRGMYPSQNSQYMPQNYGGYPPQQPTPRSNYNAGWEQRSAGPMQPPSQGGGYDYYAQGGHGADAPVNVPANSAPPTAGAPTQVNYNYGQPQGPEYGQPTTYQQTVPNQQSYGPGYEDPKYGNQVSAQAAYGGHGNAQTGAYPQQVPNQHGYVQQPYSKPPTYGMQPQGPAPQAYGPPRTQPGDAPYQNPISSTPSYGSNVPSQQYPYASGVPTHQVNQYGSAPAANDGYSQPPSHAGPTPVYPQQGSHPVQGYGQPGGQPAGYAQGGQAGYGPYAYPQQVYTEQSVPNSGGYYQAPADAGYGSAPASAYVAPQVVQANYVQPASNQPGYEQQIPQSGGYASAPAPVGYVKNLSPQPQPQPQPVYGQYDQSQMYGAHHQ